MTSRSIDSGQPEQSASQQTSAWAPVSGVVLSSLALYMASLAPTVTVGDSGELIVAAHSLGVCHPPGYPLWCLVGHAFSSLMPIGDVAWRMNTLSAVAGAAAAGGITFLLIRRGVRRWAAAAAGWAFAISTVVWSQAIVTEVYTLSAASIVAFWWLLDRCHDRCTAGRVAVAGAVFGAGLAAHPQILVVLPAVVAMSALSIPGLRPADGVRSFLAAQTVWVGPILYASYLPLSALHDPAINWGDPITIERWVDHVTRTQYGGYRWPGLIPTWLVVREHLRLLAAELGWMGVIPVAVGMAVSRHDRCRWLGDIVGFVVSGGIYAVLLAGLLRGEQLLEIRVYFMPCLVFTCLFLGVGLDGLGRGFGFGSGRAQLRSTLAVASLAALVASAVPRWNVIEMRGDWLAHDYALALLTSLPPGAELYAQGDHELFPIMYLQAVKGIRCDVRVFDAADDDDQRDVYGKRQVRNPSRPVLATVPIGWLDRPSVPWGLAVLLLDASLPMPAPRHPPPLLRQPPKPPGLLDHFERDLLARYHLHQARYAFAVGDPDSAVLEVGHGVSVGGLNPKMLNNFATLCARGGLPSTARTLWTRALELDPDYGLAWTNLTALSGGLSRDRYSPRAE